MPDIVDDLLRREAYDADPGEVGAHVVNAVDRSVTVVH